MSAVNQIASVTTMNLRSLAARWGTSLVIVIGIAGVVAVLVSVLAMAGGIIKTLDNAGRDDRAIVLRMGASSELNSFLPREWAATIATAPGIKRDPDGKAMVSAEAVSIVTLTKRSDGSEVSVPFRGVGAEALRIRPEVQLVAGRSFRPGVNEIIVGRAASAQFAGLDLGGQVKLRGSSWTVTGIFSSHGDARESELMTSNETFLSAYQRNSYSSIAVQLDSAAAFGGFKDTLTADPTLSVDVFRERDYMGDQSTSISQLLSVIAYVVGGIMAVGAVFAALNTMFSAVSARRVEIATLRAIGFSAAAVASSVLVEALLLSVIGGACGALIAWLLFNGHTVNTVARIGAGGQLVFDLTVSLHLALIGMAWACAIGLVGSAVPAVQATKIEVAAALRAV